GRRIVLKIPVNRASGPWGLVVTNLLDGRRFHRKIVVNSARRPALRLVEADVSEVVVHEADRIRAFLTRGGYTVALDPDQPLATAIRKLSASLEAPLKSVREVITDQHGWLVYRTDMPTWPRARCEQPLLLAGTRVGNPLIEQLLATGSTLADLSPNDPGHGKGRILWVPGALDGGHDVVLALAADGEGLDAVARKLTELRRSGQVTEAESLHRIRRAFVPQDVRSIRMRGDGARANWFAEGLPAAGSARAQILTADAERERRWHARSGVCTYALSSSADGRRFVVSADSWDRNLFLFDDSDVVRSVAAGTPFIHQAGIGPDGTIVAAESMRPAAVVAYGPDNRERWALNVAYDDRYYGNTKGNAEPDYLALSPDRTVVYLVDRDLVLHARELASGKDLWTTPLADPDPEAHHRWVPAMTISGDGAILVLSVHAYGFGKINANPSPDVVSDVLERVEPRIVRVRAADGKIEWDRRVPSRGPRPYGQATVPTQDGRRLAVDHQGDRIALCDMAGNLRIWDATGREVRTLPRDLYTDGSVFDLELTPDGRFLAACPLEYHQYSSHGVGSAVNRLYLFDLAAERHWEFDPDEQISDAIFDREGSRLLWSAWDGKVRAWDLYGAQLKWKADVGSGCQLLALADGRTAAATYYGNVIALRPDGRTAWQSDVTPLCYPQPRYEPAFERGSDATLRGAELGRRLADAEPMASPTGHLVWRPADAAAGLSLPVTIDVAGRCRLGLAIEQYGKADVHVGIGDATLTTLRGRGSWPSPNLQHVLLPAVPLPAGQTRMRIWSAPGDAGSVPFGLRALDPPAGVGNPVTAWEVIGPFPARHPMAPLEPDTAALRGVDDRQLAWKAHRTNDGYVDLLMLATPPHAEICAYARTVIHSPRSRKARIWLGHNLNMTIWQNGKAIYRSDRVYWWAPDATSVDTVLATGENRFLVCVDQGAKSTGDYGFWFSISDPGDLGYGKEARVRHDLPAGRLVPGGPDLHCRLESFGVLGIRRPRPIRLLVKEPIQQGFHVAQFFAGEEFR
ncbi:MAG: hypothetical protein CMJ18_05795, partial [Phycisphaeraceae bacterium]|nr:hypothetical protein [Phycisphaeraceae bacterium]